LWDLQGNCKVTFTGHNDSVWSVSFSPNGRRSLLPHLTKLPNCGTCKATAW
jgi:WD40 repeat protein